MTTDVLSVICAVVVVGGVSAFAVDRWWLVWDWWPLVGWEWRAERADRKQLEATRQEIAHVTQARHLVDTEPATWTEVLPHRPVPDMRTYNAIPLQELPEMAGSLTDDEADESWADELHAINQDLRGNGQSLLCWCAETSTRNCPLHHDGDVIEGQFGDLSRPMEELTHYEVEAVIVRLGHADWLPAAA